MVSDALKRAQTKYREKNIDSYNERQRTYYHNKKDDPEWKKQHNEKCRTANKKYREKIRLEKGQDLKPKGRPRKIIELDINNIVNDFENL